MTPDFAVIGRGLMGTACARHLAEAGHDVVLVGPDEPADRSAFHGPFGSFHDAGRITRRIATDPVWAELARRSIDRYRDIEAASGLTFYTPCGSVMASPARGPGAKEAERVRLVAEDLRLDHQGLDHVDLNGRFPYFGVSAGTKAVFDPLGGVIDPRAMRRAEEALAIAAGAQVLADTVVAREGQTLTLEHSPELSARHIVVATGAYASAVPLTPPPAMRAYGRTVVLAEVSEADAAQLDMMPSLIWWPEGWDYDLYLLPPIRYPDGRFYIKIGGEGQSRILSDAETARRWFQSEGSTEAAETLTGALHAIMPDFAPVTIAKASCAVSFTDSGYPYIGRITEGLTLLTGGNGAGAKCADELGRLGALAAMGDDPDAQIAGADFKPRIRNGS